MLSITIRTDKPEAELGLFDNDQKLAYLPWPADRKLAETIYQKIDELLKSQGRTLQDLSGIVAFQGPGSFTGLRIGLSVANTLAYSLQIPIVGETSEQWLETGLQRLASSQNDQQVIPEYGSEPNTTSPRQ